MIVESKSSLVQAVAIDLFRSERDSLAEITDLLHRAYARLAAMGFNYVAATQSQAVTEKRLRAGLAYVARFNDAIVGTITYYSTAPENGPHPQLYYKDASVAHFGQFAVSPDRQGFGIGNLLMNCVEDQALRDGKGELACDTADGADHLIAYYEKRGYRKVGFQQWPHATYRSTILSKSLNGSGCD